MVVVGCSREAKHQLCGARMGTQPGGHLRKEVAHQFVLDTPCPPQAPGALEHL